MIRIKKEIEERAVDVAAPDGKRKIKEEALDSSFPPFGTVPVRKSIDDVAPPGIRKRRIKEEPSDSFRPFGTVAVRKEVQSIAPTSIPKRKIKKEGNVQVVARPPATRAKKRKMKKKVLDDDDQIIIKKKKKVLTKRNFILVNIQCKKEGRKAGKKRMKGMIQKVDLDNLKFTPVRSVLKMSNRCFARVTAFTEENAQLIEGRIKESRWHELFCIDNLRKAKPFFWKPLDDEQLVTAILLATYQQNLGTPPTKTLAQLLEDKKAIRQAMGSGIVMEKLQEKALLKPAIKMLVASIKKDKVVKEIPKLMVPGDIQIEPSTKIVFNAPFHANHINYINIINSSAHRIAYRIIVSNQTRQKRLGVEHPNRVLDPKESVLMAVTALEHVADTVINDCINIEWINTPDGATKRFCRDWFKAPAISHHMELPIEYNA